MPFPECTICGPDAQARQVYIPYAFKYLISELASVGINTKLGLNSAEDIIKESEYPKIQVENDSSLLEEK